MVTDSQLKQMIEDAENGWSEERLDKAQFCIGPAFYELFPSYLVKQLNLEAKRQGVGELYLIRQALDEFLAKQPA